MPLCEVNLVVEAPLSLGLQITPTPRVALALVNAQGPSGPPGASTTTVTKTASGAIGGHRVVVSEGPANVSLADPTNPDHFARVLGVTTGAALDGAPVSVIARGSLVEPSWTWVPDEDVWFSDQGVLTQTPPAGAFTQCIGYALSATHLWVEISEPIAN